MMAQKFKDINSEETWEPIFRALRKFKNINSEEAWEPIFRALQIFKDRKSRVVFSVPYETPNGYKLAKWENRQRASYRAGRLSQERIQKLEELGFIWEDWEAYFLVLQKFKDRNSHVVFSESYETIWGFKVGKWVRRQRASYRTGRLSQERIQRLEELGFIWDDWEANFLALQKFKNANSHVVFSESYETIYGFKVGKWVRRQRANYRAGRLSQERIQRLEELGFIWDDWEAYFLVLQKFKGRYGHLLHPELFERYIGFQLTEWVRRQRASYRTGRLSQERIQRLEELGFIWEAWEADFLAYAKFKDGQGAFNDRFAVSFSESYETRYGFKLGKWVNRQRASYRAGRLSQERIQRLEELGFIWDDWEANFQTLRKFIASEGTLFGNYEFTYFKKDKNDQVVFPESYETPYGFKLGKWVNRQRASYRAGRLSQERIQKLEELGLIWEDWEANFLVLQEFKDINGHIVFSESYETRYGFKLGKWVNRQRASYRAGRLSQERTQKLEELGIVWRIQ